MDYLARIEPLLHGFEEAQHAARGTTELHGVLRIGVPTSIAIREVIPCLPGFMTRNPALRVDLLMEDHRQDLLKEGVDVALRFGDLADSSAVAKKIGTNHRVLAAAPAYLERAGCPAGPTDLPRHTVIIGPPAIQSMHGVSSLTARWFRCVSKGDCMPRLTKVRRLLRLPD
jgi:DNA-binding transcriptional LysR family regulator